jgi:hypothetical protein
MATDLATRKSSKSEAYLQRKFAELCARIKRVDVVTHLLALALTIFTYALFVGCFDWFAGSSTTTAVLTTRWVAYILFLGAFGFVSMQTVRCCLRRVSPYFVAHQIEQSVPGAKNSLINWLDLHEQGLPSAFQKNLSAVAAEHLEECDVEPMVPRRKNWILLGILGVPALGLAILLLLGPSAFFSSMLRAFLPFYTPPPAARTLLMLLTPAGGDAEVGPAQAVTFAVKIEGRVPSGKNQATLHYRWNADDDFLTVPLQAEGADVWSAQLLPAQLRAGVTYKITAGDAATPEHQVRTRAAAHVQKFEIKYSHLPFRKRKDTTSVFPDDKGTRPIIHGPFGSEVELTIHASRPVKTASVEIATKRGKRELPIRMLPDDSHAFACRFTLEQPGQFRIGFRTADGEDNADRDAYPILVAEDDAPRVVLTQPGIDISLPENGTLILAGAAVSSIGVKSLTLQLRIIDGPDKAIELLPQPFRPGKSFQFPDGTYPIELAYLDVVLLDQFKNDKGTIRLLRPGNVIEYWLEATDAAVYLDRAGNIGRSQPYKVTLLPKAKDGASEQDRRDEAMQRKKQFEQKQDKDLSKKGQEPEGGSSGPQNSQQSLDEIRKKQEEIRQQLDKAKKEAEQSQKAGAAKGADQKAAEKKEGPQNSGDAPQPKPSPPDGAGEKKEQGKGQGQGGSGESRDNGEPQKKNDDSAKGDKKEGSKGASTPGKDSGGKDKQEPGAGGARDGGPMGKNGPDPTPPKDNAAGDGAPMPSAKNADAANKDRPAPGEAKDLKKNGPDLPNKDQETAANSTPPPNGQAKPGEMNEPGSGGEAKAGPSDSAANPGQARGDDPKTAPTPALDELAKHLQNLPRDDKVGHAAARAIAEIAKNAADPDTRNIAKEILAKNGRDPKTGEKAGEKVSNPFGTLGQSLGIGDDIKAAAANREFLARIGQMQLDDWRKRLTPELLKKAGMTQDDWDRYVKNQQTYDALVRQLNADAAKKAIKELSKGRSIGAGIRVVESQGGSEVLQGSNTLPPAELIEAARRQAERDKK